MHKVCPEGAELQWVGLRVGYYQSEHVRIILKSDAILSHNCQPASKVVVHISHCRFGKKE